MFLAIDFDAPPSLAMGFADYHAHETLALVDADGFDPRVDSLEEVDVGGGAGFDAERIQRRHRLGKVGVTVMIVGASAAAVGGAVAFGSAVLAVTSGGGIAVGGVVGGVLLIGLGGAAFTVGEIMMFTGGIGASSLLGESTTVGWVGVGLIAGGFVLNVVGAGIDPTISTLGSAAGIAGLVCGAVQLGQAGRAGREAGVISLLIAPTPNGVRIGGVF